MGQTVSTDRAAGRRRNSVNLISNINSNNKSSSSSRNNNNYKSRQPPALPASPPTRPAPQKPSPTTTVVPTTNTLSAAALSTTSTTTTDPASTNKNPSTMAPPPSANVDVAPASVDRTASVAATPTAAVATAAPPKKATPPYLALDPAGAAEDADLGPIFANPWVVAAPSLSSALTAGMADGPDYLRMILTANVYDVAIQTPLQKATQLSARLGSEIYLKREDLQPVFSFKLRGAYNRMQQLSPAERAAGVIACSAGNHAQGVALAAQRMGIRATIVMPVGSPAIKVRSVESLGATTVLHGADFDAAKAECARLSVLHNLTSIPPYDDPHVIAGQGTVGVEILRQLPSVDAVFVCVGGGGLIAGIAAYVKRVSPGVRVIGVETYDAAGMTRSLAAGRAVALETVGLFADGAAVRCVGEETFRIARELVDEMVLVTTDEICAAIKDTFEETRSVVEPAGALGVAGCKKYIQEKGIVGGKFVAVCSGANMDFTRLRFVADRAELGREKEALITVRVPERPGTFLALYRCIYPRAATEFAYRLSDDDEGTILMGFQVTDRAQDLRDVFATLREKGMTATDASENEMAKTHAKFLIGGRKHVPHERLFRFAFPERPDALRDFLSSLDGAHEQSINISLWHYRNYGGDVGKVMVGFQVPPEVTAAFEGFLASLKYPYVEETNNPLVRDFF